MNKPKWTISDGSYVPAGFVPHGPAWPSNRFVRILLTMSLIDVFFPIGCKVFEGTISRLDRKNLPKSWKKKHGNLGAALGAGASGRHALIWLEEHGDTMIGYAFSYVLHTARVGDRVTLKVKPASGSVRRLRNHDRPRRWWQY